MLVAPNAIVAQFTMTVAIMNSSTIAITGLALEEEKFESEKKVEDEEIVKLL